MNVMLSGATGFLGTVVVKKLLKENHSVSALVRPHKTHDHLERVNIVPGDITKPETFSGAMENHDAVIHLAGSVGYGQSWEICRKVNTQFHGK